MNIFKKKTEIAKVKPEINPHDVILLSPPPKINKAEMSAVEIRLAALAKEQEQLSNMIGAPNVSFEKGVLTWAKDVMKYANSLGISAYYVAGQTVGGKLCSQYLCFSTNEDSMQILAKAEREKGTYDNVELKRWRKYSADHMTNATILFDKICYDISNINKENFYCINSEICRHLACISVVKNAFEAEGYPLPNWVDIHCVTSINDLDALRANPAFPEEKQRRYNELYKKTVANYAQMFCEKHSNVLEKLPHIKCRIRSEKRMKDSFMTIAYEKVSKKFLKYMKNELKKGRFPEFYHTKPEKYMKLPNLWKKSGYKMEFIHNKGGTFYRIGFPANKGNAFYTLLNEYNTKDMVAHFPETWGRRNIAELRMPLYQPEEPLQLIYININDIENWNRLTVANNVPWALEDGSVTGLQMNANHASTKIPVLYRFKDIEKVNAIVNRLQASYRQFLPGSEKTKEEVRKRKLEKGVDR